MADKKSMALMAHLMRRAGFGASHSELERATDKGYEAIVEELVDPVAHGIAAVDEIRMGRYHPEIVYPALPAQGASNFMYHMLHTERPLEEKMTLFWHMIFATGNSKVDNPTDMTTQIRMFRENGLGNYKDLLVNLAKDPAMIFWLDNNMSHKDAPNENWGRELLELFSMGQGNYTEDDVKNASRAFTGWTLIPRLPRFPYARFTWGFEYRPQDHDNSDKSFLGRTGNLGGEDIIDIIVQEPATHRFVARHLYNFFVADDVQVPSWNDVPPSDEQAVGAIADKFVQSGFDIKDTLRFIFNSAFFKDEAVRFSRVKNPAEVVAGTTRLVGDFEIERAGLQAVAQECEYQGQELINPPSVEGWHTGQEWIDSGSLIRRVNFVANKLGDSGLPGVQTIIERLGEPSTVTPTQLIDRCLDLLGYIELGENTRAELIGHVATGGDLHRGTTTTEQEAFAERVTEALQLIAATREYQFC